MRSDELTDKHTVRVSGSQGVRESALTNKPTSSQAQETVKKCRKKPPKKTLPPWQIFFFLNVRTDRLPVHTSSYLKGGEARGEG